MSWEKKVGKVKAQKAIPNLGIAYSGFFEVVLCANRSAILDGSIALSSVDQSDLAGIQGEANASAR